LQITLREEKKGSFSKGEDQREREREREIWIDEGEGENVLYREL